MLLDRCAGAFRFSILETFSRNGSKQEAFSRNGSKQEALELESFFQNKLGTRAFGLNAN